MCFLLGYSPASEFCMLIRSFFFWILDSVLQFPPHRGELFLIWNFRHVLNVVCFFLGNSPASELYIIIILHIKFRRQGITQKKAYNIQNRVKVWNQESLSHFTDVKNVLQGIHRTWWHKTVFSCNSFFQVYQKDYISLAYLRAAGLLKRMKQQPMLSVSTTQTVLCLQMTAICCSS